MTFASTGLFASHVPSRPPAVGLPKPAETQTDPIVAADASAQTQSYADAASQTEGAAAGDRGGAEEAKSGEATPADAPGMLPMLRRAAPLMEDVLEENLGSTALDGYPPNRGLLGEEAVSLKCSLTPPTVVIENGLQCTGVEWNASGSVLVAVFGQLDLSGWCTLPGVLAVWSVFRRDLQPEKPPETSIEHSSCLMCVACHPEQPSLVAAGSFNGEVLLFDLSSKDQPLRHSSQINDYFHREPVSPPDPTRKMAAPRRADLFTSASPPHIPGCAAPVGVRPQHAGLPALIRVERRESPVLVREPPPRVPREGHAPGHAQARHV